MSEEVVETELTTEPVSESVVESVKVDRMECILLFQNSGFHNAGTWLAKGDDHILNMVRSHFIDVNPDDGPADPKLKPLFDSLVSAVKGNVEIELVGEVPVESNGEAKHKKDKTAKTKSAKADDKPNGEPKKRGRKADPNKPPKEKKPAAEKDKFGSRLGSKKAQFNTAISKKPKSMKELSEESGIAVHNTNYNHLKDLVAKGLITRIENKFCLLRKEAESKEKDSE
jgi:hypothetical protein